ncbi:serine protease Do [Desulfacinum hydrothermale DSM 13146]|uniref:Probable periplasmic serine endoprotease DegP-like n=1 Tax=Desulfacinum hydrothermale DSM 13146 TaxID=1121390 RepID=A0A1W1XPN9_9BACT|nr:DegQ family serine endoprotease [Desulfacinum hydrothermale]SMC25478.1 serine protease Do [Desulfacinum hydrothermale DSM 13146]
MKRRVGNQRYTPFTGWALALLCAMILTAGPCARSYAAATPTDRLPDLAEQVKHSVVNIFTTQVVKAPMNPLMDPNSPFRNFFGDDFFRHFFGNMPQQKMKTHALGSGFIIDANKGLILTNNHVVAKATEVKVKLDSGREYKAKILGQDPKTDLALIQVKPDKGFPKALSLGDSDAVRVGDWVLAVGNPFGLGQTVTVGIISAKGRIIGAGPYDDFLQTDAAINPGNSGGPLLDMNGRVIGINTAIVAHGQGIGFAIPINMAKELLPQLESGKVVRGWLGVTIQDLTPELAKHFGIRDQKGVLISGLLPGSPAQKAGLQQGDVIVSFNGQKVDNARSLSRMVAAVQPGTRVAVDIIRDGHNRQILVTLAQMPQEGVETVGTESEDWGIHVQDLTPEIAGRLGLDTITQGVVISDIQPGSPAAMAGLRPGDLIVEVNRHKIKNVQDYTEALRRSSDHKSLLLLVRRGESSLYVVLQKD